jgi:hypothetical protein
MQWCTVWTRLLLHCPSKKEPKRKKKIDFPSNGNISGNVRLSTHHWTELDKLHEFRRYQPKRNFDLFHPWYIHHGSFEKIKFPENIFIYDIHNSERCNLARISLSFEHLDQWRQFLPSRPKDVYVNISKNHPLHRRRRRSGRCSCWTMPGSPSRRMMSIWMEFISCPVNNSMTQNSPWNLFP